MRAVKGKNGILSILNRDEASLFDKAELSGFINTAMLNERELYIAEELHKKNILQKIKKGNTIGYRQYAQRNVL